tara:strand:- start:270 stop:515 length:246 start_codon:yes stop_codon:yes gene_type:complete
MKKEILKIILKTFRIKNKHEISKILNNDLLISDITNYDSLNYLKFLSLIEKNFEIKIDQNKFNKIKGINSILSLVKSKKNK